MIDNNNSDNNNHNDGCNDGHTDDNNDNKGYANRSGDDHLLFLNLFIVWLIFLNF